MELDRKNIKKILLIITFAIGLFLIAGNISTVVGWIKKLYSLFSTVIAGLCIAFILNVFLKPIESAFSGMKKSKHPFIVKLCRPVSIVVMLLFVAGFVTLFVLVVGPKVYETVMDLVDKLPSYLSAGVNAVEDALERFNIAAIDLPNIVISWDKVVDSGVDLLFGGVGADNIIGTAATATTQLVSGLIDVIFAVVVAIYFLAQKERIGAFVGRVLYAFFSEELATEIKRIAKITSKSFSNFIRGQLLELSILGVLCFIGMKIFRFEYAAIISFIVAAGGIVPIVGTFIGEMIGALLLLTVSPIKAVLFLVFILCLQQIEGGFIYPKVVGRSIGIPGIIVLSAVIVGTKISGLFGALLAVPVTSVLYALFKEIMERRVVYKKSMTAALAAGADEVPEENVPEEPADM